MFASINFFASSLTHSSPWLPTPFILPWPTFSFYQMRTNKTVRNISIFSYFRKLLIKANVKAISIKRAPWNLGYKPMTVITCSLDFPEFQTWLHNDRGGVLPVAITGQVQPPGDLDQSRSDRHNSIGIWRETNPSLVCDSASSTRWEERRERARGETTLPAPQSSSPLIILQTLQLLLRLLPPPPLEPAGP